MAIIFPPDRSYPLSCAIKMAAMASYKAAPSIFTVAPSGKTNLLMRGSTPLFSSRQRIVVGRVAALMKKRKFGNNQNDKLRAFSE